MFQPTAIPRFDVDIPSFARMKMAKNQTMSTLEMMVKAIIR